MKSLNFGILGHVDSGKTTLSKVLSEIGSTAAFDKHAKNPNIRANTIDLGFSSLIVSENRICLLDCPGHASLIKTVLSAASIFDGAIIVINATKVNKIDLVEEEKWKNTIKKLPLLLKKLGISESTQIIGMSLKDINNVGVTPIIESLKKIIYNPIRDIKSSFLMYADHCFSIKGKGDIITGTIISGVIKIGIQSWKVPVKEGLAGERVALLVSSLDTTSLSRFIVCEKNVVRKVSKILVNVRRIEQFKSNINSRGKIHLFVGFEMVMVECLFLKSDGNDYELQDKLESSTTHAILKLNNSIFVGDKLFYMTAKLDIQDTHACRFAFYGNIEKILDTDNDILLYKCKQKEGTVDRIENDNTIICKDMFKKETKIETFLNMSVIFDNGIEGKIESTFGKTGKFKVISKNPLSNDDIGKMKKAKIYLYMKKYLHNQSLKSYIPLRIEQYDEKD
ncbi:Selenocysteine-specific elongation factor [Strongyloides ratti]|uniref:Selenocysteine-specific elongation factor n=1 Tax=Strongyloides ratti TaxID=34506 RepID=A0A090L3Z8_STRRB|nr:Selenocysteine-specific elongation factor [Strongyloides ratti]CEF64447.1 Selenocysteine-specific elongation factor [Strongyloides ratti]